MQFYSNKVWYANIDNIEKLEDSRELPIIVEIEVNAENEKEHESVKRHRAWQIRRTIGNFGIPLCFIFIFAYLTFSNRHNIMKDNVANRHNMKNNVGNRHNMKDNVGVSLGVCHYTYTNDTDEPQILIDLNNTDPDILLAPDQTLCHECYKVDNKLKFDCYPETGGNWNLCMDRGCCWQVVSGRLDVTLDVPYCFYPPNYGGYDWVNISETNTGAAGFLRRTFKSPYPDDIPLIRVEMKYESKQRLRIKISDAQSTRFEPPYPKTPDLKKSSSDTDYYITVNEKTTGFQVFRKSDNQIIFNTQNVGAMIFADQFLQISSLLPTDYVFGLGEHTSSFLLSTHWQKFTMWNHDTFPGENTNLYGSHPFYLAFEKSGSCHGVFLLNSNAMDVILQPTPAITFRTIGGVLDFYIFLGPTPADVARQYTEVVGTTYMPPLWSLGFHLCRYGYKTLNKTKEAWQRTRDFGIPLDVQWDDLDYMNNSNDFTYDKVNFAGLPKFVDELHDLGMKFTVLIDPGISSGEKIGTYPPYDDGIKLGIFIKNSTDMPFEGKVWNGVSTVWPDFTNPDTASYWLEQLGNMHQEFAFDGAWIDMNEPSNFYSGTKHGCPDNNLEHPPYTPGVDGGVLYYRSLCMSSKQFAGSHYNVHNLYGLTEAMATSFAMSELRSKRPFVISRSSFPGLGHFAGHWTGDIVSTWTYMKLSIPQVLNMNLFGIPLVGADICGFGGNTTASLCNRWSQLGAFYPFSRNHNSYGSIDQDPVALGKDVALSAKNALLIRYSLLPYLYTLFYESHTLGTLVARPLFFEFPRDKATYIIDEQFFWGSALMIIPVLEPDALQVHPYLPQAIWYDFYTSAQIAASGGRYTIDAPLHQIPLLLRGGYVIPMQKPEVTTAAMKNNSFELLVMSDERGSAEGSLFWDDGDTLNTIEDRKFNLFNFTMNNSEIQGDAVWWGYDVPITLGKVRVLGVKASVKTVYVNDAAKPFSYETINKFLEVEDLEVSMKESFKIHWV